MPWGDFEAASEFSEITVSEESSEILCLGASDLVNQTWASGPNFREAVLEAKSRGLSISDCLKLLRPSPLTGGIWKYVPPN